MAQLTITIPDAQVDRVLDALWLRLNMGAGPATRAEKAAWLKQYIVDHLKHEVFQQELKAARDAASGAVTVVDGIS